MLLQVTQLNTDPGKEFFPVDPLAAVGAFPVACFVPYQRIFIAMLTVDFITFFIVSKLWLVRHRHVLRLQIILRFV